jgi:hypothetical protein
MGETVEVHVAALVIMSTANHDCISVASAGQQQRFFEDNGVLCSSSVLVAVTLDCNNAVSKGCRFAPALVLMAETRSGTGMQHDLDYHANLPAGAHPLQCAADRA